MATKPTGSGSHHTLSVLVENKAGVLTRIASLFSRRAYNIYSLAVAPTEDDRFSRLTVVVDVESAPLEQITKQLFKLINVIKITELPPESAVERELVMVTVKAPAERRGQIIELVDVFEARVLNVGHDAITISLEGHPTKVDDFAALLEPYGISELQRTGRIALPKLERAATKPLRSVKAG
jgi:acetolactate synthase-1/3 small subunit